MGRIRTLFIKRTGRKFMKKYSDQLSNNFSENKKKIDKLAEIPSKKMRNRLAGYITKLTKTKKEEEAR